MCILFWTVENHPKYRFIFAANRDEFLKRPTERARFWGEPHNNILAGTDLEQHLSGTWLGITKEGRFAALTNFREQNFRGGVSRGILVRDFLLSSEPVDKAIQRVEDDETNYGGFNLICFDFGKDPTEMVYCTNRENQPLIHLKSGVVYGLSNSVLTQPWPKVKQGEELFKNLIKENAEVEEEIMIESLFNFLKTGKPFDDTQDLAVIFGNLSESICVPKLDFPVETKIEPYATKTSTVVLIDYDNNVTFVEREWYDEDFNELNLEEHDDVVYHFNLK